MVPLHELLARIRWDPDFGRGEFVIGYLDHSHQGLVYVPLSDVHESTEGHFAFEVAGDDDAARSIPYHRVKEVWKDGALIWRREH